MQQSQIIGIGILSSGRGGKIVYVANKEEEGRSLRNTISQTSKPALFAFIGCESEASISDNLQNHPNHALIQKKSQQLAGEAAVPVSVISSFQVDKLSTGFLFSGKMILDFLREQNNLVYD